jgi:hypothetical protein
MSDVQDATRWPYLWADVLVGRACLVGNNLVTTSPPLLTPSQPLPGGPQPSYPHRALL